MSEDGELDPELEALLAYLARSRGFDFSGYKRNSLRRRIDKRMQMLGPWLIGYAAYIDYLEVHPEEFGHLFDTILINVTAFFRDPPAWEALREEVIPRLLDEKAPSDPIRIWCAGCASGEEAYSLAMAMAEAMGIEPFRERVKIYATDVDQEALSKARLASYDAREVQGVPPDLLAKYFEPGHAHFSFLKEMRRSVIFGRHDLIQNAPISRIDLLSCRNTLMYFNTETQARILERFHFALNDRGRLFLGKAETSMTYTSRFVAANLKRRLFTKVERGLPKGRQQVFTHNAEGEGPASDHARLLTAAFESNPVAHMVVDSAGMLTLANDRARLLFGLSPENLGRPLQDLKLSYRPAELRSCIERAHERRHPVILKDVEWSEGGASRFLDVRVAPLIDRDSGLLGAGISFQDETASKHLRDELNKSHRELETAYEELQSTVEELETTNEELQSTNEELETMNEELQSTNEELEPINEELRRRGEEVDRLNAFLKSILAGLRGGVVVVDPELLVHVWNEKSEDLWGLRSEEVRGKNFLNLDIGLPVHELRMPIRACLSGTAEVQEVSLLATNRRGKPIQCKVTCSPMGEDGAIRGAILMMEDGEDRAP